MSIGEDLVRRHQFNSCFNSQCLQSSNNNEGHWMGMWLRWVPIPLRPLASCLVLVGFCRIIKSYVNKEFKRTVILVTSEAVVAVY